ncbi:alpha-1A adrenergic receptor [Hydra vulgaris]|uniref:Alpha-1A adrenergic receptor n=1 Tax=Hydra vulgaris TaxID=6087 RepID=A0ABM4BTJ9_HYDVU
MAFIDNSEMEHSNLIIAFKSTYLFMCFFLGVIGNSVVIITILKNKKMQTVTNWFILNLAIADILFTIFEITTIIITSIAKRWLLGNIVCDIVGFMNSLFCITSIWTLVMISINRFLHVAKPNDIKIMYTKRRAIIIIIGVWVFSLLISFPPLTGWSQFKSGANFCTVDGKKSKSYSIFLGTIAYVLPMFFLASLYSCIFFLLHKHEKTQMRSKINSVEFSKQNDSKILFDSVSVSSLSHQSNNKKTSLKDKKVVAYYIKYRTKGSSINEGISTIDSYLEIKNKNGNQLNANDSGQLQKRIEECKLELANTEENRKKLNIKKHFKEVRITKMLLILVLCFFFCWTPVFVGSLLYSFNTKAGSFNLATFGIMCACLNSILNPIIYSVMNRGFRKYIIRVWRTIFIH